MSSPEEAALLLTTCSALPGPKHQRILGRRILNLYYLFDPSNWAHGSPTGAAPGVVEHQLSASASLSG